MRVPAHEAEVGRARFLGLASEGFEEREVDDELELAAYTDESGEDRIRAAFSSVVSVDVELGWEDRWREFHHAVRVGGVWIGPPWEAPPPGELAVVIDPGRAFGTGAHPTTRACIELLAGGERGSLVDAGCGSGVLAIAAARLGFAPVVAVDVDEVAVAVARENARLNGVQIEVRSTDVVRDPYALPAAGLLVANIELTVVEALLARWPGTRAVASGYLADAKPDVAGWALEEHLEVEGWSADRFVRVG